MKRFLLTLSMTAVTCSAVAAQSQDIGLWLDGGMLTVIYGQDCGPVGCAPMFGGTMTGGEARNLTMLSAPQTLYALAIGTPGGCVTVPGFDNAVLLQDIIVLDFGLTSAPPFVPYPCQQGLAGYTLQLPASFPAGIVFRLQSLGVSVANGVFGFGPAIEVTTV